MRETITALRNLILDNIGSSTCGFSSDNIPAGKCAENTAWGNEQQESDPWSSLLFQRDKICIYLKYDRGADIEDAQQITLHGNEFGAVRLALVDWEKTADFNVRITKQKLFNELGDRLPRGRRIYEIETTTRNFRKSLGHVLVLCIRNTGTPWNIGANLNPNQLKEASADLADKVVATLKDLLPVAKYYADNREALLSGMI